MIIALLEDIAMDKHIEDIAQGMPLFARLAPGKLPPANDLSKTADPRTSGTIVVAEDDEVTRLLLSRVLTRAGFTVYACENGRLACEVVRYNGADVVLLDWMMPVMDGPSAVAYLKADLDTCEIPVVMLTTRSDVAERTAAFNSGVQDFLTKPFNTRELVARIEQQMRRHPPEKERSAQIDGTPVPSVSIPRIWGETPKPHIGVRAA